MTITIEIKCDNAAFDEENGGPGPEVGRLLRKVAALCEADDFDTVDGKRLMDVNGNHVGNVTVDA